MRNKNLRNLILALAWAPVAGQAAPAKITSPVENFEPIPINGHKAFVKAATYREHADLLPPMIELAGEDIILIEPARFNKSDYKSFLAIPANRELFPVRPPEIILKSDPPFLKRLKTQSNEIYRNALAGQMQNYFDISLKLADEIKSGENHVTKSLNVLKNPACLITGALDINASKLASQFGGIPAQWKTPEFDNMFNDQRSFTTFIMLHESAHCSQKPDRGTRHTDTQRTLTKEIDADRKAIVEYKKLIAQGAQLDPDMPEKVKWLRFMSPVLQTEADAGMIYSIVFMHNHATAEGLDGDTFDVTAVDTKSRNFSLIVKAVIYDELSEDVKAQYFKNADDQTDVLMTELIRQFSPDGMGLKNMNQEDQASVRKAMNALKPMIQKTVIAGLAQQDDPELVYQALQTLAERGWSDEKFSLHYGDIQGMAKKSLVGLEYLKIKTASNYLPFATTEPVKAQNLAILTDITNAIETVLYEQKKFVDELMKREDEYEKKSYIAPQHP